MRATALSIVKTLQKAGFEAYFVGGAVRDMLMGKRPLDFDITTSAKPEEIEKLLKRTIPIGKQFGVILVVANGHSFEVATFRSDSSLSDGRRPDAIYFTSAKEDALRRDFTVNAIFYNPIQKKVIDYVGGQKDLKSKTLRFVGDPEQRIKEDHLRILRAVRFKNLLSFKYGAKIKKALKENAKLVMKISSERIGEELTKTFLQKNKAEALRDLSDFGILKYILPELESTKGVKQPKEFHMEGDVFTHTCMAIDSLPKKPTPDKALVFATLFHDIGKVLTFSQKKGDRIRFNRHAHVSAELALQICKRLKFSKLEQTKITWLIEHHMSMMQILDMRLAHQHRFFSHMWFDDLLALHKADAMGSNPVDLSLYYKIKKLYKKSHPIMLPEAHLMKGDEIMKHFKLGASPQIGEIKRQVRDAQIEGTIKTKEEAWGFIEKLLKMKK